jgi:hypothetical protein
MNNNQPWALDMKDSTELSRNERENIDLDRELDSSSTLKPQIQDSDHDIYLSEWADLGNANHSTNEPESHSVSIENDKLSEKSTNKTPKMLPFHAASQIKLYNKATHKAALVRLGRANHGLITIVVDMCFHHYGNARDWQHAESAALSMDELLTVYGQFKNERSVNIDLQFHANTTSPVNIMVTADKLVIKSGDLHLTGKIANKVKFMAMVDSALRTYVGDVFPNCTFDEFVKFY